MSKKNKNKNAEILDSISLPKVNLDNRAKKSITIVFLLALGLVSLLALFNLSGNFGLFLHKELRLVFGYGKWFFPILLLVGSFFLYKGKKHHITAFNYIGLLALFISLESLFHFFLDESVWRSNISLGIGGGYVGFYLATMFNSLLGFWGGLVILFSIFLVSLVLIFNAPLSQLIGPESIWVHFFKEVRAFFSGQKVVDEDEGYKEDKKKVEKIAVESEKVLAQTIEIPKVQSLFKQKNIKGDNKEEDLLPNKVNWSTKAIKIDLPLDLLSIKTGQAMSGDIKANSLIIQRTLENFGIPVEMGDISVGPTVTQYSFKPAEGIKLSRITALNNDLSLALAAHPLRIEAPIPGKALVGIEVPNKTKAMVGLREVLEDKQFKARPSNLFVALGKDVSGVNWFYDIPKMPHLLVAGATNSGKSVCLNTIIVSLLYQNSPESLRFIMVDPKRVELPAYNGIPHLLTPVITEVSKTINALKWCLNEMDRRYDILNKSGQKNIQSHNAVSSEKMPYIIFIIDELADLMVTSAKDIEGSIIRLTQMSRAVGIHLILATQRPSVDVITGLIKANIPARIAFSVASAIDSKTILDCAGAEKLLGKGDMLFAAAEMSKPKRIQGAFVSDDEIFRITNYIKEKSGEAQYMEGITDRQKVGGLAGVGLDGNFGDEDDLLQEAKEIVVNMGRASTSLLQRRLRIGYSRAASILDALEEAGIVGPSNGAKPREILISQEECVGLSNTTGPSGMPLHSRESSSRPSSFLEAVSPEEEGDDDVLEFDSEIESKPESEIEKSETEEEKEDVEGLEEDEIPKVVPIESSEKFQAENKSLRAFSDDDEGMYFSK